MSHLISVKLSETSSKYLYNSIKNLEKTLPEILFIGVNMHNYDNIFSEPNLKKLDSLIVVTEKRMSIK